MIDRTNVAALIPCYFEERFIARRGARASRRSSTPCWWWMTARPTATEANARAARVEVIRHPVNQGKGAAIKTGLRTLSERPGIEYALILDGDGQHAPEEIPRFLGRGQ